MLRSFRIGHATNSSSAHSIIFHPGQSGRTRQSDCFPDRFDDVCDLSRDRFWFTDPRAKAEYILLDPAFSGLSAHQKLAVREVLALHGVDDLLDLDPNRDHPFEDRPSALIDRALKAGIPIHDWLAFLLSEDVTVYGYDDNSADPGEELMISNQVLEVDRLSMRWKFDDGAIVGYHARSGSRLRWSRDPYDKATTPELVDVKITDYCPFGCAFCYQGSTVDGRHAPLSRIEEIFDQLAGMQIFEVAIGGGEPAHHPDFAEIIHAAHDRGLTFNFTCYGLDWLKTPEIMEALEASKGFGVGVSVHTEKDLVKVDRVRDAFREARIYYGDVIAQTVVGATPYSTIWQLTEACIRGGRPLLLLGYKSTGRGVGYDGFAIDDDEMRRVLEAARNGADANGLEYGFHLSVDTAFLDLHGHLLDEMGVPAVLRTSPEGKFSMYIDAVADTCGPSSYCASDAMAPRSADLVAQFAQY